MITSIENTLRSKRKDLPVLSGRSSIEGNDLRFLKYSTPISGKGLGNKVLFFVFAGIDAVPSLIVKTIRTSRDAYAVENGHANLRALNAITNGSSFARMFPQALSMNESEGVPWSIETACIGRRAGSEDLDAIIDQYTAFVKHCRDHGPKESILIDAEYGKRIIRQLSGSPETLKGLETYLDQLWKEEAVDLPRISQHGDLTVDNVMVEGNEVRIIDCDTFGNIAIPGFDIWHLLSRSTPMRRDKELARHFYALDIVHIPGKRLFFIYFLHELLIKKDYILIGKDAASVVLQFEDVVSSNRSKSSRP